MILADILVLGLGNVMRGDDAIGVRVAELLREEPLPPELEVRSAGMATVDILEAMARRSKVVVIDAVQGGGKPGSVYRFAIGPGSNIYRPVTSLHDLSLLDVLALAEQMGTAPGQVIVIGVEPRSLDWGAEITSEVAVAAKRVISLVLDEITRGE